MRHSAQTSNIRAERLAGAEGCEAGVESDCAGDGRSAAWLTGSGISVVWRAGAGARCCAWYTGCVPQGPKLPFLVCLQLPTS